MFGRKKEEVIKIDWSQCEISPQNSLVAQVSISNPVEYAKQLINQTNRSETTSISDVLTGVYNMIGGLTQLYVKQLNLSDDILVMFKQIILRNDFDFQMLLNALSYFGSSAIAIGNKINEMLETEIPETIVSLIVEGQYDNK